MTTEPEMFLEQNAEKSCCVNGEMFAEHKIAEGLFNGRVRHNCPRCGIWLEPEILGNKETIDETYG